MPEGIGSTPRLVSLFKLFPLLQIFFLSNETLWIIVPKSLMSHRRRRAILPIFNYIFWSTITFYPLKGSRMLVSRSNVRNSASFPHSATFFYNFFRLESKKSTVTAVNLYDFSVLEAFEWVLSPPIYKVALYIFIDNMSIKRKPSYLNIKFIFDNKL